jgi:hypothetical protein
LRRADASGQAIAAFAEGSITTATADLRGFFTITSFHAVEDSLHISKQRGAGE